MKSIWQRVCAEWSVAEDTEYSSKTVKVGSERTLEFFEFIVKSW